MKGNIDDVIASCYSEFIEILNLKTALTVQLEQLLENPVFKSNEVILDSEYYQFYGADVVYNKMKVVADHFK